MGASTDRNGTDIADGCVAPASPTSLRWLTLVVLAAWAALLATVAGVSLAADLDAVTLAQRYEALRPRLAASPFGRPLVVDSGEDDGRTHGEIHGEIAEPFTPLAARLSSATEWCDIIALHINVKACTPERAAGGDFVTVYSGRKSYETIERAYAVRYAFRVAAARHDYLKIVLAAPAGPLGTRDYELALEAMPVGGRSFIALRYSFRPSVASRLATATYLATLGSGKPGFTIVGRGNGGEPEWIGGMRGIVERSAMRNFLALDAWLQTRDVPAEDRFERRLQCMAALTGRYPLQLVEMPAAEYVAIKRRERQDTSGRERTAAAAGEPRG